MAFVVEDGNGLPTANAYIDVAYADAYFADRAITAWTGADNVKQAAIIKATDYIDKAFGSRFLHGKAFVSVPSDETLDQALEFPRDARVSFIGNANYTDVQYVYRQDSFVTSPLAKPVQIPRCLKQATAEYALRALSNALAPDPEMDASGLEVTSKTEQVGPITETVAYFNAAGIRVTQPYPAADLLLKPLIRSGGMAIRG